MDKRIINLYQFLQNNREQVLAFQRKCLEDNLRGCSNKNEIVFSMLYGAYYTQSRPKLDLANEFFKEVNNQLECLSSFRRFGEYLESYDENTPFKSMFFGLSNRQQGWGPKTSALFLKSIYQVHFLPEMEGLQVWDDIPTLKGEDRLYLPVDAVIRDIFKRFNKNLNSFWRVNDYLENYGDMEVWDDLWFWGFLTQKGTGNSREIGFNEAKYWSQRNMPKDPKSIADIECKCKDFVSLLPKGF